MTCYLPILLILRRNKIKMFHEDTLPHVQNLMDYAGRHFCIFSFVFRRNQIYIKLSMGFLKVPLWGPDSFQFMLMTFRNQYRKVNYIFMLTTPQLL